MRVVHLDAAHEWRGGQTQLLHLVTRGPRPAAVVIAEGAPLGPALDAAGVEVVRVPLRGRWFGAARLRAALDALRPDLVAAHDGHGAALALGRARWPVVVHRRVDFAPSWLGARRYRRAAGVIAVSRAVAAILERRGVEQPAVVHDGVDPAPWRSARPDPALRAQLAGGRRLVVAVGALVEHKGHDVLARAMGSVPDAVCVVLGEGPRRNALVGLDPERFTLVGRRDDVPRWVASADLFVHPSRQEGLGQAVIEAGLTGTPVVTTAAGGLPELGIGRSCPPDDPVALARAVVAELGAPTPIDTAALADRFSIDRMVEGTLRAYGAIARGRRAGEAA